MSPKHIQSSRARAGLNPTTLLLYLLYIMSGEQAAGLDAEHQHDDCKGDHGFEFDGYVPAEEMLDAGETKEVSVKTERLTTVVRMLTDEYFVALALEPGGNVGKARYLLRTSAPTLIENL